MMNDYGKSDNSIVPKKLPNKTGKPGAEAMEERELAKGNPLKRNAPRTQGRIHAQSALKRIRRAAGKNRRQRLTALFHHVYDVDQLREAYYAVKRTAAAGIDGWTWHEYGKSLEENLQDLSHRLRRGAYRARPVQRRYVPKTDGRQRPIGVPVLEDKIVQRAVVAVLNEVYERDFLGFSYGFRPERSQHQALDALDVGIMTRKVSWVLDADIRAFLETSSYCTPFMRRC
jgi:RNA-directed DNA polymerase